MTKSNYKRLGEYIEQVNVRNRNLSVSNLMGVSIEKCFIKSIANTIGTDLSPYKIVKPRQFAYGPVTSRNGEKITIALYEGTEDCIISQAYEAFRIKDENELLPEYLMMWAKRPEFDRYARYMSHGSVREIFSWEEMCNVMLPVPPISEQRRIVNEYQTVERRIANNEALIQKLEETAQAIYHHTFVEGIDEDKLPEGWRMGTLKDIAEYKSSKIVSDNLNIFNYISTENMLKDKKGVVTASSVPSNTKVTEFCIGDILISNIRPYFKKIWLATNSGGCSNDVLCLRCKGYDCHFVYNTIFSDVFFDYITAGCKGTKMPRGDKEWIMNYPIVIPSKSALSKYSNQIRTTTNYKELLVQETHHLRTLLTLLTSKLS